jgi:hypothetical protein
MVASLRVSVDTGTKVDESSTGHVWAAGFHHVTARSPPQFSNHHPTTKTTLTQGKSITQYNSASMIVFYQPINFYIIVNLILFIAEYPDYIHGHVNIILIKIIL